MSGKKNENDNNKNRRYVKDGGVDSRVAETYGKASRAKNKNALSDTYVKAFRWATDRISRKGIVSFVSNSGFVDAIAADGMRMHLSRDFDEIYILDLGGNVRKNPKLSGTTHNVFGIQLGVSINIFVRHDLPAEKRECKIFYAKAGEFWTRGQKEEFLHEMKSVSGVKWQPVTSDSNNNWTTGQSDDRFAGLIEIANPEVKEGTKQHSVIFKITAEAQKPRGTLGTIISPFLCSRTISADS